MTSSDNKSQQGYNQSKRKEEQDEEGFDDEEFQDEDQDIADARQWKEKYNQLRHDIFEENHVDVLRLLALNKTTKLKHTIVTLASNEDDNNFDRQRERELIFKKIKSLRVEMRICKESMCNKRLKQEQISESFESLQNKFDELKKEQMNVFCEMETIRTQLELSLQIISEKIIDDFSTDTFSKENHTQNMSKHLYNAIPHPKQNQIKQQIDEKELEENENESEEIREILNQVGLQYKQKEEDENEENIQEEEYNMKGERINNIEKNEDINEQDERDESDLLRKKEFDNLEMEYENAMCSIKERIQQVQKEMEQLGGECLGWEKEDQAEFLKVRGRLRGQMRSVRFLEECAAAIGVHSIGEIEEHVRLYEEYLILEQERKECVFKYKQLKKEKERVEEEEKQERREKEYIRLGKTREEMMEERLKKKEIVREWKTKRIMHRNDIVTSEIEEKRLMQDLDKQKRLREEKIREDTKFLIQQYKEQKENEMKKIRERDEMQKEQDKNKRRVSVTEISRIREKEQNMMMRKQQLLQEKKIQIREENIQRIKLLNKDKFSHIDARLTEQTKATERKATQKYDFHGKSDRFSHPGDSFAGNLLGLGGRLKIPTWRQSNL